MNTATTINHSNTISHDELSEAVANSLAVKGIYSGYKVSAAPGEPKADYSVTVVIESGAASTLEETEELIKKLASQSVADSLAGLGITKPVLIERYKLRATESESTLRVELTLWFSLGKTRNETSGSDESVEAIRKLELIMSSDASEDSKAEAMGEYLKVIDSSKKTETAIELLARLNARSAAMRRAQWVSQCES